MLYLKSLLLTILIPGAVILFVPYLIMSLIVRLGGRAVLEGWGVPQIAGVIGFWIGAVILLHSVGMFAWEGRGTLAPFDPPKQLVVKGFYRYVRNPMYVAALMMLSGEALYFESVVLLVYAGLWFALANLVVVFYEETTLRDEFGESYDHYSRAVHRWMPGKPYQRMLPEGGSMNSQAIRN
jgi:protein-S-isoprenylcysteine O-methyltransferase Ste14